VSLEAIEQGRTIGKFEITVSVCITHSSQIEREGKEISEVLDKIEQMLKDGNQ
jgi:hypothetical protein